MLVLKVEGMSCSHCERAVRTAVGDAAPGAEVAVDLGGGEVRVGHGDPAAIIAAIEAAGYGVRRIGA